MSDLQDDKSALVCQMARENPGSKMVEDESKSPRELLGKKSGSETTTSDNISVLSTHKDSEYVVSVRQVIKEASKDLPMAEVLDGKRDSSVKSGCEFLASEQFVSSTLQQKETVKSISMQKSEISTAYKDDRIKFIKSSTVLSSLDVGNKAVKESRADNREREESSNLSTTVDSSEKTNESSNTLVKMLVVKDSNKAQKEKEGDGKMSDMPMINITLSEGKSQRKLQNTGQVLNSDFQKEAAEILLLNLSTAADFTDKKLVEDKEISETSIPAKVNMPVRSPTQIKIDFFRELEGSGCLSPPMSPRKLFPRSKSPSVEEKSPNQTKSETAKVKKSESDIVSVPQSSETRASDIASNKLFPRSKSPSVVEKSPKQTTPETAKVKNSESDIVSVFQSSVICGSDITTNKSLELNNQQVKCERQVTKPVKENEESIKTSTQSKRCIEISAPKRQAKRTDPTIIATGTRFRILLDVSLFEKESLSIHIVGNKIDVYCKQVNENEFGEEVHEMHQVFRIPAYVDDTCFTASITENDMLLLDAPFEKE